MGQEIIDNEPDEIAPEDEQRKRKEFYSAQMRAKQARAQDSVIDIKKQKKKLALSTAKSFLKKKIIIIILSSLPVIIGIIVAIIFIIIVMYYIQSMSL